MRLRSKGPPPPFSPLQFSPPIDSRARLEYRDSAISSPPPQMSGSRDGDGLIPSPSPKVEDLSTFRKYIDPTLSSLSLVFFLEFDSSIGEKEEEEYKFRLVSRRRKEGREGRFEKASRARASKKW